MVGCGWLTPQVEFFRELSQCDVLLAPLLKGRPKVTTKCMATRHRTRDVVTLS